MKKLTSLAVALLAVPFICSAQISEDMMEQAETRAMAEFQRDTQRARIKSMSSVSWRNDDSLNIRIFMCDGRKVTMKSFTGKKDGKNEYEGKWVDNTSFNIEGDNVTACGWTDEKKAYIRVFVGGDDRKITEHSYVGEADLKVGEQDYGTWKVEPKTFRGETASIDINQHRKNVILNLFTANRDGNRLKYYTQRNGREWKEVDLDLDRD